MNIFNSKEVSPTAIRMFPLKTERSSSGLIEFPTVADAVIAIMKCNHIPVENKGGLIISITLFNVIRFEVEPSRFPTRVV